MQLAPTLTLRLDDNVTWPLIESRRETPQTYLTPLDLVRSDPNLSVSKPDFIRFAYCHETENEVAQRTLRDRASSEMMLLNFDVPLLPLISGG